jgi:tyrosine-protein phosphatase YwqE
MSTFGGKADIGGATALAMARQAVEQGATQIAFTPHILPWV